MKSSELCHPGPSTGKFWYYMGRIGLLFFRWRIDSWLPDTKKAVMIAAPHTSNWDMPLMLVAAAILRVRVSWLGKKSLFRWPFGGIMRWLGGIPVDRASPQEIVNQIVEIINTNSLLHNSIPSNKDHDSPKNIDSTLRGGMNFGRTQPPHYSGLEVPRLRAFKGLQLTNPRNDCYLNTAVNNVITNDTFRNKIMNPNVYLNFSED